MKLAGLNVPSVSQIISLAVTLIALLFIIRVLPIPENVKALFRV